MSYGSQAMAFERINADFEHHKISEWEVNAVKSYKAVHMPNDNTDYSKEVEENKLADLLFQFGISNDGKKPMTLEAIKRKGIKWQKEVYNAFRATNNLGSITNIKGKDLKIADTDKYEYVMSYSFPCFIGSSLVLTSEGFKEIKDIKIGDKVLTHTNEYKTVLNSKCTGQKKIHKLKAMSFDEILCTENHKFYTRERYRKWHRTEDGKRECLRLFKEPVWKEFKDLTKDDYLGMAINRNSIIPKWDGTSIKWKTRNRVDYKNELSKLMSNPDFWWIVGRFIGDGWVRAQGGITICCPFNETDEVVARIEKCGLKCTVVKDRTTNKINIYQREVEYFFAEYGKGAINKHLPGYVFDMPVDLLESLLDGYMSADGYVNGKRYRASSISKELIYGIGQIVAKVYHRPVSIHHTKRNPVVVIEGRTCHQHDTYTATWKRENHKQDIAFYEDGYIWFPIKELIKTDRIEDVYDIEVEDNHSFTVNNCIVHNCTNLSLAGKQAGMKKGSNTSSSLLWEIERIFNELKEEGLEFPQILVMENVPQVISAKHKPDFDEWVAFLESLGYTNNYQILNAKDFGVAQNRKRCFMISVLGNYRYEFPHTIPLKKKLKNYLENDVDESYYITSEKADKLIENLLSKGALAKTEEEVKPMYLTGMVSKGYEPDGKEVEVAGTLMARDYKGLSNFGTNGVVESIVYDDYNHTVRSDQDTIGTLTTNCGNNALGNASKIIEIGNLNPKEVGFTNPQTGRVYSTDGISPTLNTCGGGQREPKIITKEENGTICLNSKGGRGGKENVQPSIQDRVYSTDGCMTAITTSFMPSILEQKDGVIIDDTQGFEDEARVYDEYAPSLRASRSGLKTVEERQECIVAMRGRNPENPLDRTVGVATEQRLEPNEKGLCNTLTTVQKDNLVLEEIKVLGNYMESGHDASRVVDANGLAPTVKENHGTVTATVVADSDNPQKVKVRQATKQGYIECDIGGVADLSYPTSDKRRGRVQDDGHICPTLTCGSENGLYRIEEFSKTRYRIRKLTERECGRLMGVTDEDITKMMKVNAKSQLYKQYGNSIVVNCLVALFSQLGIGTIPRWNDGLYKTLEEEGKL